MLKVEEFSWKDEQEHEPAETEIPENVNNLEINGEAVHSGPVGKFIRSLAAYHLNACPVQVLADFPPA